MRGDAAELEGVVSMVRALVEALVAYADTMREGFPANALSHQHNACHFKMPIWPVNRHSMPVDRVNMAEILVNRTPPCVQAQTIPIQDTVLSTGHIVLLTGQLPSSHGLPCEQGSTM